MKGILVLRVERSTRYYRKKNCKSNRSNLIWCNDVIGKKEAEDNIIKAIEKTLSDKKFRTKDLNGSSNTRQCAKAIFKNL